MNLPLDLPTRPMPDVELRCGDWRNVLADVECDALICDPPYGERTHEGNDDLPDYRSDLRGYAHLTPDDVRAFVASWSPRCKSWMACMTSDDLVPVWRAAYADAGRFDFAPVPILQHRVRMVGDGPGSGAVYLMVARPREARFMGWGSLPCWYMSEVERQPGVNGAKPVRLMRAIVRDYSKPGDLVCDPCAGSGTTLVAARIEGRRAIGAELDDYTWAAAQRRLSKPYTPDMFTARTA